MRTSEKLQFQLSSCLRILLADRYFRAGVAFAVVITLIEFLVRMSLGELLGALTIGLQAIVKGGVAGLIVGLLHLAIVSHPTSPYYSSISWARRILEATAIGTTVFIGDAALFMLVSEHSSGEANLISPLIFGPLLAAFAAPLAIWTLWSTEYQSSAKSATNRRPHFAIGAALTTTVVLLSSFTVILGFERNRAWLGQAHVAQIIDLASRQRMLSQRISNLAQRAAALTADQRSRTIYQFEDAVEQLTMQSEQLNELIGARTNTPAGGTFGVLPRLDRAMLMRNTLLQQAGEARSSLEHSSIVSPALHDASESYLKAMEGICTRLQLQADAETNWAIESNAVHSLISPLLLLVILCSVVAPLVRIFQSQFAAEHFARLSATSALTRLETYQTALDDHFSVVVTDPQGLILEVNKKFCLLCGYSSDDLRGQKISSLNAGIHSQDFFKGMWNTVASGNIWSGEICNKSKDRSLYWVQAIIFPIFDPAGGTEKYVSIRTDITNVKRQSAVLKAIVDGFPGGVALIDKDNRVVEHNSQYRQLLDLPDSLFVEQEPALEAILRYEANSGEFGAGNVDDLVQERLMRVNECHESSYEWVRPTGQALDIHRTPISGGGYVTTYIDNTDRKAAQSSLKRAHAQLTAFVKHAPVSIAMLDNGLRYVGQTERWIEEYDLGNSVLTGRHLYDVFPDLREDWKQALERGLEGIPASSDEDVFERLDGTNTTFRWEVHPWRLSDNNSGGILILTEDISERKQIERSLWRAANIDGLTGLANRRLFYDRLSEFMREAIDSDTCFTLGLVDIDKFKEINDTLGHDAGDEMLSAIGKRLEATLGNENFVARLGGDEFAFVIRKSTSVETVRARLAATFASIAEPIDFNGSPRMCTISCGITTFPTDANKPTDLLKNADLALYSAKSHGRNRFEAFQPSMRSSLDRSKRIRKEIAEALENDALCLYFQPFVETNSGAITGFEALLRWRHPTQGILPPGAFLEAFEDASLCAAIGVRVLELAMKQIGEWNERGIQFGYVAINVTSADFAARDFCSRLMGLLQKYGASIHQLSVEVTEGMFLGRGAEAVKNELDTLQNLGVKIALDDFGTGYASLTHLKKFPIDCLKIDRSFVHDMESDRYSLSIVRAVIQLALSLNLSIVAEGVEKQSQRGLLDSFGCPRIQGYLIAKPLAPEDIPDFLSRHTISAELMAAAHSRSISVNVAA